MELTHKWFEATDTAGTYVRIALVDYSKAFDLIDHNLLVNKLVDIGLPRHIVRWTAAFLADRSHRVKLGAIYSSAGYPNGGVPQGTVIEPKTFLVHVNDLRTPSHLYQYVDFSTLFEICNLNSTSELQESVNIISEWSREYRMKINVTKTKEMVICFCKDTRTYRLYS